MPDPARPRRPLGRRAVVRGLAAAAALGATGCTRDPDAPTDGASGRTLGAPPACDEASGTPARPRRGRVNVVVVSVDDLGWQELGCYGSDFNETPEIDRMAAEGVRFTQADAAASVCSPSRAALVTGLYPGRTGITDYLRPEAALSEAFLSPDLPTVPDVLGVRGYSCGLVGKWHLTEVFSGPYRERPGNPFAHGFDDVVVTEQRYIGSSDYVHPYAFMPDEPAREPGEYLTDRVADEVEAYLARHRTEPFFVHVSNYAVHTERVAKPALREKYAAKADEVAAASGAAVDEDRVVLAAMLESVDDQVGRLRRALECQGLADDTVVMITSDNGGSNSERNLPLRGGKGELYEGGIRVPLVVWGPGVVDGGRVSDLPVSTVDLLPTAADLAGVPAGRRPATDGVSLLPTLTGRGEQEQRDATYWVFPHHFGAIRPYAAVRAGDEKLLMWLRDESVELYDLAADPGETDDLAARRPASVTRLRGLLRAHLDELDLYPGPPPDGPGGRRLLGLDADLAPRAVVVGDAVADARLDGGSGGGSDGGSDGARLVLGGGEGREVLVVTDVAPGSDDVGIVATPAPLRGGARGRNLLLGLAGDGGTSVLLRYRHDRRGVAWEVRLDGELRDVGAEPLRGMDGTVDLSRPGSRLALRLRGHLAAAYVEQGEGWELLFRADVGPALDLGDPGVRAGLRYAVGARTGDGEVVVERLTARTL